MNIKEDPSKEKDSKEESAGIDMKDSQKFRKKLSILFMLGIILVALAFLIDHNVLNLILSLKTALLIDFFSIITMLGDVYYFVALSLIITVFFIYHKKPIIPFWISILGSFILIIILKGIINRSRPFEFMNIPSLVSVGMSSFPSGHAFEIFCILPFLTKAFPRLKVVFWTLAVAVGFSRIYLEVHYLSDVLAGAFLGYIIGYLSMYLAEKYAWKIGTVQ